MVCNPLSCGGNLEYDSYIENVLTEMSYLLRRFLTFGPNDGCYGQIHGIVCCNGLILHTSMHLWSTDNTYEGSSFFYWIKKPFSIFRVSEMFFFVKDLPQTCWKTWGLIFSNMLDYLIWTNKQFFSKKRVPSTSFENHKFLPIQLETGQIWTTSAS